MKKKLLSLLIVCLICLFPSTVLACYGHDEGGYLGQYSTYNGIVRANSNHQPNGLYYQPTNFQWLAFSRSNMVYDYNNQAIGYVLYEKKYAQFDNKLFDTGETRTNGFTWNSNFSYSNIANSNNYYHLNYYYPPPCPNYPNIPQNYYPLGNISTQYSGEFVAPTDGAVSGDCTLNGIQLYDNNENTFLVFSVHQGDTVYAPFGNIWFTNQLSLQDVKNKVQQNSPYRTSQ